MQFYEQFEQLLRETLTNLYNPSHHPDSLIWQAVDLTPLDGKEKFNVALIQAIEDLKPASDVPLSSRANRLYELLSFRYVHGHTQAETAVHLGLSPRHLRREQQEAIHLLARSLWRDEIVDQLTLEKVKSDIKQSDVIPGKMKRRFQIQQELSSLHQSAPDAVADVAKVIRGAVSLGKVLAKNYHVELIGNSVSEEWIAQLHPSVLNQIILKSVEVMVSQMSNGGLIEIGAKQAGNNIIITVNGNPILTDSLPSSEFIETTLNSLGGDFYVHQSGQHVSLEIKLLSAEKIIVLVVEDNDDLVHFYRRCAAGTKFHISHISEGLQIFEVISDLSPDIIVLDVMLPDVDGWELLTKLHEHHATSMIPVIVCSVVGGQELAQSLGAARYLSKPVGHNLFIETLQELSIRL